jgi:transposase InsO family protein
MEAMLLDAPELEAKSLFEYLMELTGRYEPGQLRTFQRRVRRWQALHGPDKEVYFPQQHRPGEAAQTDFTWATELGITIAGELFEHKLCVVVLPYSNWCWATVCKSESMAALKHGVQEALFRLGRRPEWHQTDNSTAATHDVPSGKREFNVAYVKFIKHLGMKPRTIGIGKSNQNGDVEATNGAVKRRIKQHLLLRGSADFSSVDEYVTWLTELLEKANGTRGKRFEEELDIMEPLQCRRLPAWTEMRPTVSSWSTIRVKNNAYSIPARLIGQKVRVRIYDDRIEVYFAGMLQLSTERLLGRNGHRVDYRHIIWWLVRKPGAFARYRYREELFPSVTFRRAYDLLCERRSARNTDLAYLRILHLAASTMESEVEVALEMLQEAGEVPDYDRVKTLVAPWQTTIPELTDFKPELTDFDVLLQAAK